MKTKNENKEIKTGKVIAIVDLLATDLLRKQYEYFNIGETNIEEAKHEASNIVIMKSIIDNKSIKMRA